MSPLDTLPRTSFVLGKGGVGRSTLAAAIGLAWARRGQRCLVVQATGDDVLARWYGHQPPGYTLLELAPQLFSLQLRPRDALQEYLLRQVRLRLIYRLLFANRPMHAFLDAVLGLSDLIVLGKIVDLERETRTLESDGSTALAWDRLVVDLPATGHALTMLHNPASMLELTRRGPLNANAQWIQDMLEDPARSAMALATWAEELPVTEAIESIQALGEHPKIALAVLAGYPKEPVDPDLLGHLPTLAALDSPLGQAARQAQALMDRLQSIGSYRSTLGEALPGCPIVDAPTLAESVVAKDRVEALATILEQGGEIKCP